MQNQAFAGNPSQISRQWSTRVLVLALIGIFFLTFFPFRVNFHPRLDRFPLLLGGWGKDVGPRDAFLNVLLFMPFGFGLAAKLRERGKSAGRAIALALAAGALLSYTVEFSQLYIPGRDSGWEDVITNGSGSGVGALLFAMWGEAWLGQLSRVEDTLAIWFRWPRLAWILLVYFALCFGVSVQLQKQTRLADWDPNCVLTLGNDANGQPWTAWQGKIWAVQFWDRALPDDFARALTAGRAAERFAPQPVASYTFADAAPFQDQAKSLPELSWTSDSPAAADPDNATLDGKSWLTSAAPASALIAGVQETNQFAVHVICETQAGRSDGRIVSLARAAGATDLVVRQAGSGIAFWLRNPLSVRHPALSWYIPSVFETQRHDFVYSYDGSSVSLFMDGRKETHVYRLGPGAGIARMLGRSRAIELEIFAEAYYAAIFCPVGILAGIAARKLSAGGFAWFELGIVALAPPVILELLLSHTSGRDFSFGFAVFALALVCGSALWINLGEKRQTSGG